jgi:hypothetical protein
LLALVNGSAASVGATLGDLSSQMPAMPVEMESRAARKVEASAPARAAVKGKPPIKKKPDEVARKR